jgi:hypothetical protein
MDRLERVSNETSNVPAFEEALEGGRMPGDDPAEAGGVRPFRPPGSATWQDFEKLDLRVGRIVRVEPFPRRVSRPTASCWTWVRAA